MTDGDEGEEGDYFSSLYRDAVLEALGSEEFSRVLDEAPEVERDQLPDRASEFERDARAIVRSELTQFERADGRLWESRRLIHDAGGPVLRLAARAGLVLAVAIPLLVALQTGYAVAGGGGESVLALLEDRVGVVLTVMAATLALLLPLLPQRFRVRLQRQTAEELEIDRTVVDHAAARARLVDALLERAVKPTLRALVNSAIEESWSTEFAVRASPGLHELSDPSFEVPTGARLYLAALLANRGSGSIGVAGPRGAGKSTLINALADPDGADADDATETIGIVLSAPVRYDPRDFLLHLFARLAERVVGEGAAAREEVDEIADLRRHGQRQRERLLLVAAAGFLALALATWLGGSVDLGLDPSQRAAIGFLGLALASLVGYSASIGSSTRPATADSDAAAESRLRVSGVSGAGLVLAEVAAAATTVLLGRRRPAAGAVAADDDRQLLRAAAARELQSIRFQQTFSSGWSGSLKLPAGVGLGTDATLSLARSQMTLPEIADRFVDFARRVAEGPRRRVVIGIDELDKMESEEAARQFVDDVKSVFEIPGCYYLISVSEDAMSGFDRRGMPFRDVFDSSLDEVFYVPYLRLDEGTNLLRSRVIGLSVPFQCLCFALSGGLARDLVRVTRQLVACHRSTGETSLGNLSANLIGSDIATKNRASVVAARRTASHACVGLFTGWLREGDVARPSPSSLEARVAAFSDEVVARLPASTGNGNGDQDRDDPAAAIRRIGSELIGYHYFAATVLRLFGALPDREGLERAIGDGRIDSLACARQDLAVSPLAAWATASEVREATDGLEPLEVPAVLQTG